MVDPDEAELIDGGLPYLHEVWSDENWRLFRVDDPVPLGVTATGPDWFEIEAPRPGSYPVALNFTSTWTVTDGDACVERGPDDSTVVAAHAPGTIRVQSQLGFGSGC